MELPCGCSWWRPTDGATRLGGVWTCPLALHSPWRELGMELWVFMELAAEAGRRRCMQVVDARSAGRTWRERLRGRRGRRRARRPERRWVG